MPNSANKSKNNSNSSKGHAQDINNESDAQQSKPNPERSDLKHQTNERERRGDSTTGRSSNQGRKESSGGEVD